MKGFIKKLCGFSIGPIVGALISFITIPITTYFVSPEEYGKVTMFTLVQSVFTVVAYLGLDQSYTRFYNEEKDKKKLLFNCIVIPMIFSIFLSILLVIEPKVISKWLFESPDYTLPIYILALTIPLLILERFLLLSIRMEEMAVRYSLYNISLKLIVFFVTLYFVLNVRRDFLAIVYSSIIGQIIGDILLIITNIKRISFNFKHIDKSLLKELLKFGLPLILVSVIGWALNSMDKVFLRVMSNFEQLGYYNIAMKISNMLLIIQSSFTAFWVPTAYRWYKENKDFENYNLVSKALTVGMSIIFLIILLLKDLIPLFISQAYNQSIYIIPFLLFYPIMYTISETTTLGITFSKKSYLNLIVSVLSIITNLFLNFILVPKYAAVGAAIATGISYIVFFWARTIISRKIWYKFKVDRYVYITIVLLIAAIYNTFNINRAWATLINLLSIVLVIYIERDVLYYIYERIFKKIK